MVTAELCTQHGARVTGGDAPGGRLAGSADADWRKAEDTGALPPALTPVGFASSLNNFFFFVKILIVVENTQNLVPQHI